MLNTDNSESKLAWLLALASEKEPERIAETHGLVVGLLCAEPDQDDKSLARHLAAMQVGDWTSEAINEQLGPALKVLREELGSPEMKFQPLLPTEDRSLQERTRCLACWCSGFLAGFGAGQPVIRSDETRDALLMLERIAQAGTDETADQEEEETAYTELMEFVRVAVLMLREESLSNADSS